MSTTVDMDKIRALERLVRLRIRDLSKSTLARTKGIATDYAHLRDYVEGDDPKSIDWKATARRGKTMVRVRLEEKEQTVLIMLDVSSSMSLGGEKSKIRQAIAASAALAYLAVENKDRVGLLTFSSFVHNYVRPGTGTRHLYALLDLLVRTSPSGNTDIENVVFRSVPLIKTRSLVVMITDLCDDPQSMIRALRLLSLNKHKVVLFHIYDPDAFRLPDDAENVSLIDPKTGKEMVLNVKDPLFRATYRALLHDYEARRRAFEGEIVRSGADIVPVRTTDIVEIILLRYLLAKKRGILLR